MKRLIFILTLLLIPSIAYAGQVSKPKTFSAGAVIAAADVNSDFDTIYNEFNGSIEGGTTGNIAADTLTEREMADDINGRIRWDEGFRDFVYTGLTTATVGSLNATIAAGTCYVDGYRINKASGTSKTVTNNKDTWYEINAAGTFGYQEVANGTAQPAATAGYMMLGGIGAIGGSIVQVTDARVLTPYVATGKVLQMVNTQTGASTTGTTAIPMDDTIPQITEGDEYMTLAITPTSATSTLKIDVVWCGASSDTYLAAALFKDAVAGALACGRLRVAANEERQIIFTHYMTAGTTSAITFSVRAGNVTGATVTFNGGSGVRVMGGVLASSITISEITT